MLFTSNKWLLAVAASLVMYSCGTGSASRMDAPGPAASVETGAHWASPTDFPQLKRLGYQFAVVSLDRDPDHWREVFDAADRSGIRVIAGLHPYPYRLGSNREWEIEPIGQQFIKYAQTRGPLVKAIFVFNEPYWIDPATGAKSPCGAVSAAELRGLRTEIHKIWPQALIYHDLGRPSFWSPGGGMERENPCVGNRYADVAKIADYVGIWFYPVNQRTGYVRDELVRSIRDEIGYVTRVMGAEAIVLGQAFRCARCSNGTRLPSIDEIRDINCTLRWLGPQGISWYPWRQPAYEESLVSRRELWDATGPKACPDGNSGS